VNGYIKTGGKIRQKYRDRDINSYSIFDGIAYYNAFITEYPDVSRLGRDIYMENFLDPDFEGYTFAMGPEYKMPYAFDDKLKREHYDKFSGIDALWKKSQTSPYNEFVAMERIMAGYVMAEINIGNLMILPGVRYEQDFNEYSGTVGYSRNDVTILNDTTGNRTVRNWLPMMHIKYNFIEELSIRLAATKTLTRPDFMSLTPFERINYAGRPEDNFVYRGSLDLKLPTSWNYDAFLNYYSRLGLVSAGVFYKKIENVDIDITYSDYSGTNIKGDPDYNPTYGMNITNPINSKEPTTVWGAEFEIQTNFRWLPKPFDGIILNANFSLVNSETYYPFFPIEYLPPTWLPSIKDTARINRLPGQADKILNVTLGYEKKGFSARVTMNFQGNKLTSPGEDMQRDKYAEDYLRWDAVVSQEIGKHWRVLVNFINFTNEPELSYSWKPIYQTSSEYYGWAINLAVRYDF
jgi:TonB-dependent receptor